MTGSDAYIVGIIVRIIIHGSRKGYLLHRTRLFLVVVIIFALDLPPTVGDMMNNDGIASDPVMPERMISIR